MFSAGRKYLHWILVHILMLFKMWMWSIVLIICNCFITTATHHKTSNTISILHKYNSLTSCCENLLNVNNSLLFVDVHSHNWHDQLHMYNKFLLSFLSKVITIPLIIPPCDAQSVREKQKYNHTKLILK